MGTRLQGVTIPVTLDTSGAQRQLDELENNLKRDEKKSKEVAKTVENATKKEYVLDRKTENTTGSGGGQKTQVPVKKVYKAPPPEVKDTKAIVGEVLGTFGKGAAIYAAVSTAIKVAAPVATGIAAFGGNPDSAGRTLDMFNVLRERVEFLESYVKSIFTGAAKGYEAATATAYVQGKVPNLQFTYELHRKAEMEEDRLNKRLGDFRSDALASAVGRSLADLMKGGINK